MRRSTLPQLGAVRGADDDWRQARWEEGISVAAISLAFVFDQRLAGIAPQSWRKAIDIFVGFVNPKLEFPFYICNFAKSFTGRLLCCSMMKLG